MTDKEWFALLSTAMLVTTRLAEVFGGVFATTLVPSLTPTHKRVLQPDVVRGIVKATAIQRIKSRRRAKKLDIAVIACNEAIERFKSATPDTAPKEAIQVTALASILFAQLEQLPVKRFLRDDLSTLRAATRALSRHELPDARTALQITQLRDVKASHPENTDVADVLWHLETRGHL